MTIAARVQSNTEAGCCEPTQPTWRERLLRRLFPPVERRTLLPDHERWSVTTVFTQFGWPDRLRILVGGWLETRIVNEFEVMPGNVTSTDTTLQVMPPNAHRRGAA